MHFLKIEHDSTKNWFYLEKFNKRHEFYCKNVENIRKFINILKLYCVSSNFLNNYKILDTLGKGHFSQVPNNFYSKPIFNRFIKLFIWNPSNF